MLSLFRSKGKKGTTLGTNSLYGRYFHPDSTSMPNGMLGGVDGEDMK